MKFTLIALSLLSSASADVLSLTPDNVDSLNGKAAFIKFFAPWCGHCKSMAGDWIKLADEMSDNDGVIIAEADCTSDDIGSICSDNGVEGFPTLKYGDIGALTDYQGGRDYESLFEFTKENVKPGCSPARLEICDDAEKANIQKYMDMSPDEISKIIAEVDAVIEAEDQKLADSVKDLSAKYEVMVDAFETQQTAKKEEVDYKLVKAVFGIKSPKKAKAAGDDDDDDYDPDDEDDDDDIMPLSGDDDDDDDDDDDEADY
eukprot:CAMPEP_0198248834 /NCGR_PEP_ID=MMETSP1447-20131203/501_1 /TAXON_ID=420782 /ORGANISM="Chaetoceros dichaeta, Strain CCMP1751" /LENGTH=258 /DNA_ID=CAMNT_0043933315 /DNA_START=30 /DNA_END=809 /DNA_ORIENTATION=-